MNRNILKHTGLGIVFVVSHVLLFQYLRVFGTIADPVLIYLVWLCTKYNRTKVLLFAAGLGLLQDSLFDLWGLYMFSKTLLIFMAYNPLSRLSENRLLAWQIFILLWGIAFIHNCFFLALGYFIQTYSIGLSPFLFIIGSSFYTALVGVLLYVLKGR